MIYKVIIVSVIKPYRLINKIQTKKLCYVHMIYILTPKISYTLYQAYVLSYNIILSFKIIIYQVQFILETKAYRIGSEFILNIETHTKYTVLQTFQNNLGFSLYTILLVCYEVTTLEVEQSSKRVSSNYGVLLKNIRDRVQLRQSIFRLVKYSVFTSFIYKQKIKEKLGGFRVQFQVNILVAKY